VGAAVATYNAKPVAEKSTKYVANMVAGAVGQITVTLAAAGTAGLPADAAGTTLVLTPNVQGAQLAAGVTGAVDWACASVTNQTATTRGLVVAANGTLPAKYAPAECR